MNVKSPMVHLENGVRNDIFGAIFKIVQEIFQENIMNVHCGEYEIILHWLFQHDELVRRTPELTKFLIYFILKLDAIEQESIIIRFIEKKMHLIIEKLKDIKNVKSWINRALQQDLENHIMTAFRDLLNPPHVRFSQLFRLT